MKTTIIKIPDHCYDCILLDDEFNNCNFYNKDLLDYDKPPWCNIKEIEVREEE